MNKKKLGLLLALVCIAELLIIMPLTASYFGMSLSWQVLYAVLIFGFPVLMLLPIAAIVIPIVFLFKKHRSFWEVWSEYTWNTFFFHGIILSVLYAFVIVMKIGFSYDLFILTKYEEVEGFKGNTEDIRHGVYHSNMGRISRYDNKQLDIFPNGDTVISKIEWLSNNEYRLLNIGENIGMVDTLDVKVTENNPEYYECYVKHGKYAEYYKFLKNGD